LCIQVASVLAILLATSGNLYTQHSLLGFIYYICVLLSQKKASDQGTGNFWQVLH